jgi:hypothetical protein
VSFFLILVIFCSIIFFRADPDEMWAIKDMVLNFYKNSRYFLLCFFFSCPYPHTFFIKDGSLYFRFSNIDDFFSLVIKLNMIMLNFLLLNYISFIILGGILGGFFILMENGSSSGYQGQGSNNFTRNMSVFFKVVLGNTKTDSEMLADFLQVKLDELNKKGVKNPKSVHGQEIGL